MVNPHLPWKFHAKCSSRFLVILLTKKQTNKEINKQTNKQTRKSIENNTPSPYGGNEILTAGTSRWSEVEDRSLYRNGVSAVDVNCRPKVLRSAEQHDAERRPSTRSFPFRYGGLFNDHFSAKLTFSGLQGARDKKAWWLVLWLVLPYFTEPGNRSVAIGRRSFPSCCSIHRLELIACSHLQSSPSLFTFRQRLKT